MCTVLAFFKDVLVVQVDSHTIIVIFDGIPIYRIVAMGEKGRKEREAMRKV
jgi:hypothetical protein